MIENNTYQSGLFITLARDAEQRCTDPHWNAHAVTSVVMAYMSIEALVNEIARLSSIIAKQDAKYIKYAGIMDGSIPLDMSGDELNVLAQYCAGRTRDPDPEVVRKLAAALVGKDMEATEKRYDLILETVGAAPGYKGREPRQSFNCLAKVRNYLVHCQSQETTIGMEDAEVRPDGWYLGHAVERHPVPKFAAGLEARCVIPRGTSRGPIETDFVGLLCTRKVATWACDVAASAAREILRLLPASELKKDLGTYSMLGSGNLDMLVTKV